MELLLDPGRMIVECFGQFCFTHVDLDKTERRTCWPLCDLLRAVEKVEAFTELFTVCGFQTCRMSLPDWAAVLFTSSFVIDQHDASSG